MNASVQQRHKQPSLSGAVQKKEQDLLSEPFIYKISCNSYKLNSAWSTHTQYAHSEMLLYLWQMKMCVLHAHECVLYAWVCCMYLSVVVCVHAHVFLCVTCTCVCMSVACTWVCMCVLYALESVCCMHMSVWVQGSHRKTLSIFSYHSLPYCLESGSLTKLEVPCFSEAQRLLNSLSAGVIGIHSHPWLFLNMYFILCVCLFFLNVYHMHA